MRGVTHEGRVRSFDDRPAGRGKVFDTALKQLVDFDLADGVGFKNGGKDPIGNGIPPIRTPVNGDRICFELEPSIPGRRRVSVWGCVDEYEVIAGQIRQEAERVALHG